jgi:hypothetical protein
VGRSFGAVHNPLETSDIYDSLFFRDAMVEVKEVYSNGNEGPPVEIEKVTGIPKDAGIFHFPGQLLYRFEREIRNPKLQVTVSVPGLPAARAEIMMVSMAKLSKPKQAQQYVYLVPDNPLRVHWKGNAWNEVDIAFEFIEHLHDSVVRSKWVHIQNTNSFDSPHELYREMKITYDEFVAEVLLQIEPNDSVKEVYLGYITLSIHGGDENMVKYKNYLNGYSDFNVNEFSNIENGIGLLASRTTFELDSLRFDYDSREKLKNENRLKVLKLSPWN